MDKGSGQELEGEVDALKQELAQEKKQNEELLTRLKYAQADLENLRKRMDKEVRDAGESVAKSILTRMLVVQDELDLASKQSDEAESGRDTLKEGILMVRRNLLAALESAGVERIDAVGKPFDPNLHEAVEKVEGGAHGKDVVVEEVRPGFTFRGTLLRPTMVKVELASKTAEEEREDE